MNKKIKKMLYIVSAFALLLSSYAVYAKGTTENETVSEERTTVYIYDITSESTEMKAGPEAVRRTIATIPYGTRLSVIEISEDGLWGKCVCNNVTGWIELADASKIITVSQPDDYDITESSALSAETVAELVESSLGEDELTAQEAEEAGNGNDEEAAPLVNETTETENLVFGEKEALEETQTFTVVTSCVNIRSGAGAAYESLTSAPYGSELKVRDIQSGWGKTELEGTEGWVSLQYLEERPEIDENEYDNGCWKLVEGTWCWVDEEGNRIFASDTMHEAWDKIQGKKSGTQYYICVNCTSNETFVFIDSDGNWVPYKLWLCDTGMPGRETVHGEYTISSRGYSFSESENGKKFTCYYWTKFNGPYLFHTVLYDYNADTVYDGRLGMNISHGCVRLEMDNAVWIYENCDAGTKVYSYK